MFFLDIFEKIIYDFFYYTMFFSSSDEKNQVPTQQGVMTPRSKEKFRIGISGYGRIGRNVHRMLIDHPNIEVMAINSRAPADMRAHLLKYDSLHGTLRDEITADEGHVTINGNKIVSLSVKETTDVPWNDYGVDLVLESSGRHKIQEEAAGHLGGSVKNVLVSAPMKDNTPTFVFGVNEEGISADIPVMSNASCTTNCIAPVLKVILEKYGIENVFVTSIHSFTASQNLLDNSGRDFRRARSTTENIIPTTTGSIKATSQILPELEGKIDGLAFRVPTPTVSICDVRLVLKEETTEEEINEYLRKASQTERYKNIIRVCDDPLVSADFVTDSHSSIVDSELTKVVGGKYVQLQLWYDNEWGYAARLIDVMERIAGLRSEN